MGKMAKGWVPVPFSCIVACPNLDAGAKLMLMALWTHSDWRGSPHDVHGFTWASVSTLSRETRESTRTARKRLTKLVSAGYVIPLWKVSQGELYIANHARQQREIKPIKCACKCSRQEHARQHECSCRVLRPIREDGTWTRDPPGAPPDIHGIHVGRERVTADRPQGSAPQGSAPQGSAPTPPRGRAPTPPGGTQTS